VNILRRGEAVRRGIDRKKISQMFLTKGSFDDEFGGDLREICLLGLEGTRG